MKSFAHSFDIYDTLLVRTVFSPEGIFLLVGEELVRRGLWKDSPQEWSQVRRASEGAARAASSCEIRFSDIRDELYRRVEPKVADLALELELELELQSSVGIFDNLEQVRKLIEARELVCYISDMYLPSTHISRSLEVIGAPVVPLYISADSGKTKRSGGELFEEAANSISSKRVHLRHTGDNRTADVNWPRKLGFTADHFIASHPTIFERHAHDKIAALDPVAGSVIAGSLKAARLSPPLELNKVGRSRWLHATQVGAVLQLGFISWIVQQIRELMPDQVFFLARDGYVPWKLYEQLRSVDCTLPPSSYLYVSRQSLHAASMEGTIDAEDRRWIFARTQNLTFGEWLFRLGLQLESDFTTEEVQLLSLPTEFIELDDDGFKFCEQLIDKPLFKTKVLERAAEQRSLVLQYLKQEGLTEATHPCFVDIGWHGRMQRSLVKLARRESNWHNISGLYFGLISHQAPEYGAYRAWLFDKENGRSANIDYHLDLYEILFAAPHATTFGYECRKGDSNGTVYPRLAGWDPLRSMWPDIELALSALIRMQQWMQKALDNNRVCYGLSLVAVDAAYQWLHFPNQHQVLAYSDLEFGSDQINLGKDRLIYPIGDWQCIALALHLRKRDGANQWLSGQAASVRSLFGRLVISTYRLIKIMAERKRGAHDHLGLVKVRPSHF